MILLFGVAFFPEAFGSRYNRTIFVMPLVWDSRLFLTLWQLIVKMIVCFVFFFVLFAIFILHSRESELYRYILDGKSALAWELPFSRFMGHLSST